MALVTLTTDFGAHDHYAAVMKAMVLRAAPKATLIDVTHEVPKFNRLHGARILRELIEWFPPGTVHLAVIDPGVGGRRAIMAFRYNGQYVVCPDNGLITIVHKTYPFEAARRIDYLGGAGAAISTTFHGRDVMAPAAGFLAAGGAIERLGPPSDRLELLELGQPHFDKDGALHGTIVHVDSFGNLITDIHMNDLAHVSSRRHTPEIYVGDVSVGPLRMTYGDVPVGKPLALLGSSQMLEVAVNQGDARDVLGAEAGGDVIVR
jgi:S-adenosylmethionine hydrolase